MSDVVNQPDHYKFAKVEVLEALESWNLPMHCYSAVQYIARADKKGTEIQDLNKAIWYLRRRIEVLEAAAEGREPCKPKDMKK